MHVSADVVVCVHQGFRVVPARMCYHKSLFPLMDEIRKQFGDGPVYISFDIDALDPSFAPGTGTWKICLIIYRQHSADTTSHRKGLLVAV